MKISSAKAKGRRAAADLADALRSAFDLEPEDIRITSSSVTGEDLLLSPAARKLLPFAFEVKNQERLNVWDAFRQALRHVGSAKDLNAVVVYTKNRSPLMVTMELSTWLKHYQVNSKLVDAPND